MPRTLLLSLMTLVFMAGMALSRPFRLGVDYTSVGVLIMLIAGIIACALCHDKKILTNGLKVAGAFALYWWVLAAHSYVMGGQETFALTAFLANSLSAVAGALFFSSLVAATIFLRFTLLAVCALTVSALVTFGLHYFAGTPFLSLVWANLPVSDSFYARSGDVLFPFSIAYNYQYYGTIQIPRMSFGLREVGITQAFLGWVALATLYIYRFKAPKPLLLTLGVAILFTQSIAFIVTVLIICAVYVAMARIHPLLKMFLFAAAVFGGFYAVLVWLNDATFGFASRTNTESLSDRTWAIANGLQSFSQNPLGIGFYNAEATNASITLIAQLQEIGITGAVGFVAVFLFAHTARRKVGGSMVPYLPILAAAITTQPLLDAPGFMPLIFAIVAPPSTDFALVAKSASKRKRKSTFVHA